MSNQEYLNIFKQLFSDKLIQRNNPSILTKETAENIYHLNLASDSYKIIKKVFKTYLSNSQLENLDLKDMVLYFNNLSCSINTFFLESRILWHEINEIIYLKKDVLQKKDFLKEYFYKKIRNKINSLQEQIIVNVLKILKQKEELKLANEILIFLKEFNVYDHFFGKLSKKNVQILRRENFSEKITKEQKICLIYDLLKKEKKKFFIKKFYKKVETDFLKKYFKIEVEGLFEFEKKSLGKFFRLVEKIKNRKEFYKKMNNFLEKEVDFYDFCCFITKLNNFYEIICQLKLEENFKKELSNEIYFSLENFVLKHEKTFFKRSAEEIKRCDIKYLQIVALFFKICAEKEEFNELLREIFADLLLKQESQKLEIFLKICHKEKVGKNNSFKLENMLNEFNCKKMCKNSEIITISSVYWPKFENENLNLVELENIKNKFLLEEKRKNPKIKYEFNDLISLCEISFNESKLQLTLLQYKIILLLKEKSMTYKKLKSFFNTTFFDENYDQLLSNQVIIDKSGLLFLTSNKITNQILPNNFPRTDTENEEIQEKTTFLLIDSKIMTIMKKEKKIKEDFLKNMIDEYKLEERIELLIDKGYLKREKNELIYVP